jgi:acetyl/propionyl-CoA carboxylase alpha subunit
VAGCNNDNGPASPIVEVADQMGADLEKRMKAAGFAIVGPPPKKSSRNSGAAIAARIVLITASSAVAPGHLGAVHKRGSKISRKIVAGQRS